MPFPSYLKIYKSVGVLKNMSLSADTESSSGAVFFIVDLSLGGGGSAEYAFSTQTSLALSAGDNTLVAEYTMPAYMNVDDAAKVKPLLRKLVYRWNGERFVID